MPVLYMGDGALENGASYLAGVMKTFEIDFDHMDPARRCPDSFLDKAYDAVILSDYPSANFTPAQLKTLKTKVESGMGLVMIGGWDSFVGQSGHYDATILREVLPVEMHNRDDRVNCSSPCVVEKNTDHAIIESLPFAADMPCVGGFNEVKAKANSVTILSARRFKVSKSANAFNFIAQGVSPLLVVGMCGKGRVAAFMSDVAPHWIGGLVDWGSRRITAQSPGASQVEIGEHYAGLFANIIRWTSNTAF